MPEQPRRNPIDILMLHIDITDVASDEEAWADDKTIRAEEGQCWRCGLVVVGEDADSFRAGPNFCVFCAAEYRGESNHRDVLGLRRLIGYLAA